MFLTNKFTLRAAAIYSLCNARWQAELLFEWVKQHLRFKQFSGPSNNAVRSQILIAMSVYVLVTIVKKRLNLDVWRLFPPIHDLTGPY